MRKIDRFLLILMLIAAAVSFTKAAVDFSRLAPNYNTIHLPLESVKYDVSSLLVIYDSPEATPAADGMSLASPLPVPHLSNLR